MKKIYISENTISNVVNGRLLPQFLFKLVKTHTTSLGDNEAFPSSDDYPFDYVLLKKRYNEVCDAIDNIGLVSLNEDDLVSELSSLVTECKRLEEPVRDALEKICENALNRLFAIPEESINMSFKLVDKIKFKSAIRMRPESNDDVKYSFKDIADIDLSNKAVGKRRFINALIQGAAYLYSGIEGLYIDDIDKINPKLPRLYRKIRIINDYLLFTKKEEMSDDKPMQGSYVETHLGIADSKTTIKIQGLVFPLLFQESIKGLFELFSAHGLPQDRDKAQYIVKKADFVLAEPWDLRLGVGLWEMIFGGVEDTNMIPYMFTSFVKIPTNEFNLSVKEILSNTEKGNEIVNNLMKDAEYDNGYQQFTNRINAKNVDKSLIKDSYFTGAETNGYELDSDVEEGDVIEEDGIEELSHQTYQNASAEAFDREDNRLRKFRKAAEHEYANSDKFFRRAHQADSYKNDENWITLNNGKKLVIFDDQYKSLNDLYNGVKQGKLLIHARGMGGEISDDMKYIEPCFDKTMKEFYGNDYDEMARSKSEYYGEEIEPEYPELIFASDDFSWCNDSRNGIFFIESDGFQKSLGDGMIQLPNGKICKYWESDIYDYDNDNFKEEPLGVEYGDWYSKDYATVVAVMNINDTIKETKEIGSNSEIMGIIANATVDNIDFIEGESDEYGEKVYLSVDGIEIPSELVNLDFRVVYKRFPTGKQQLLNIDIILDPQLRGYGLGTKIYAKAVREFGAICSRHSTRHNDDGIRGIFGKLNSFNDIAVFQDTYNNLENETICDYYAILKSELPKYFGNNITESRELIYESQESKSIAAAKKLVMQRLNYNEQEADEFIRIKLRNDIPSLRTPQGGKFILGVARMFCDGELRTANDIGNLNSTLKLVASDAHINEYDRNLNGMSCQELIQRFAKAMSDNLEAEKAEIGQMAFNTPSDYEIVRIDSVEQASNYGRYTSWCVTHQKNMFDSYTSDGINQFYFCLKNGFENVEEVPSEGCPLDEYGLSMIAVSVNGDGILNTCTCRWNHDNGGDDSIMNAKQVSQVIGMNFFEVFKPNNVWNDLVNDCISRVKNGEDTYDVFDSVGGFNASYDLEVVELQSKYNYIDENGNLLSKIWFDYASTFSSEGFGFVHLNSKKNLINKEGKFLIDRWIDEIYSVDQFHFKIRSGDKYNLLDKSWGLKIVSNMWFDNVEGFDEYGFARVGLIDNDALKVNLINKKGNLLSNIWFDDLTRYRKYSIVQKDGKYNILSTNGTVILNEWCDYIASLGYTFVVELNNKLNILNFKEGKLYDKWFDGDYCILNNNLIELADSNYVYLFNNNGSFNSIKQV